MLLVFNGGMIVKKILYIVLFLSLTLLTVGCGLDYKSRSKIYYLGDYYKESGRTFKAELDKKNERFIFYYYVDKSSQNNYQMEYSFCFRHDFKSICNNSIEGEMFEYVDKNNNKIKFDKDGKIKLNKETVLYTYYKNATLEVKKAIEDQKFQCLVWDKKFFRLQEKIVFK